MLRLFGEYKYFLQVLWGLNNLGFQSPQHPNHRQRTKERETYRRTVIPNIDLSLAQRVHVTSLVLLKLKHLKQVPPTIQFYF